MRPTPETDQECFVNEGDFVTGEFARNIERHRAELLEALEKMLHLCEHDLGMDEESPYIEQARAAIAAVKGGE